MKVAILGCGPAGLLAAHACSSWADEVEIYTKDAVPSYISGAQYLHSSIPLLTSKSPFAMIKYVRFGTKEGYASKIYGSEDAPSSWDKFPDEVPAWPLQEYYDLLWDRWRKNMRELDVDEFRIKDLAGEYDYVFSSVPLPSIMPGGTFTTERVWISNKPSRATDPMTIVYNGFQTESWYRRSNLFGHESIECPQSAKAEELAFLGEGWVLVRKPVACTQQQILPSNVELIGRYGRWEKGQLVDHVYKQVWEFFNAMQ